MASQYAHFEDVSSLSPATTSLWAHRLAGFSPAVTAAAYSVVQAEKFATSTAGTGPLVSCLIPRVQKRCDCRRKLTFNTGRLQRGTKRLQLRRRWVLRIKVGECITQPRLKPERDRRLEFQQILGNVLPPSLGFVELVIRPPDVVIRTKDSEFLFESMSGGVSAIIELAWQIFLRSRDYAAFTVCIDEPENHLHPSLQRSLLPTLLNAFPGLTFIVATHSPFVVTAVPDSHVYVLDREDDGVVARLLSRANMAASPDETLRRVLGLEPDCKRFRVALERAVSLAIEGGGVQGLLHV